MAFSALMTTTAAAPSLMPEALPAVTVPVLPEDRGQLGHLLEGRVHGPLVDVEDLGVALLLGDHDGDDLVGHGAAGDGRAGPRWLS